jgi:hypothetical protein
MLIIFSGQYVAALGIKLLAADHKPALTLAGVLPSASVFRGCTKTLSLAAVDARTSDINRSSAFVSIRNDPTRNEQERNRGRNRLRLGFKILIVAPKGFRWLGRTQI